MSLVRWDSALCLVTGASSGFGLETARALAGKGATVIAVARREEKLKSLVDELGGHPHSYITCDVSDLDQIRSMAKTLGERIHHTDVLINNAGVPSSGPLDRSTSEEVERVIRTNLLGPIWCTKELLPLLEAAPRTARTPIVVNVASMAGRLSVPRSADYTASKHGLVGFTESVWHDLRDRDIRVMMVNPGGSSTEGFQLGEVKSNPLMSWILMEPDRVARALIRGIERGGTEVRVQWWLHPLYHFWIALGPLGKHVAGFIRSRIPGEY